MAAERTYDVLVGIFSTMASQGLKPAWSGTFRVKAKSKAAARRAAIEQARKQPQYDLRIDPYARVLDDPQEVTDA